METGPLVWGFVLAGLLYLLAGIPLALSRVPPNRLYGFRVKRTLEDPPTWYRVNRVLGQDMILSGVLIAISSVVLARMDLPADRFLLVASAVFGIGSLLMVLRSALTLLRS